MTELFDLQEQRKKKTEELRQMGIDPYPYRFEPTHHAADVLSRYAALETGAKSGEKATVAGRLMTIRFHGKTGFAHVQDTTGKIQIYIRKDDDPARFALYEKLDMGDIVGVSGEVFKTRTGEVTLHTEGLTLLAKALLPLPEKWHGLHDIEIRYRQRYLDLIANPPVKATFELRSKAIRYLREFLDGRGFLEVETPMMQPIPGGAAAKPFMTHHNALDLDLYLRIAPELYLKRLLVGGYEKVYEINRNFRNEGISIKHNPEFTMLELYEAYRDYQDMMALTEEMFCHLLTTLRGSLRVSYQGQELDFTRPWKRLPMDQAVDETLGINTAAMSAEELAKIARDRGLEVNGQPNQRELIFILFDELVEKKMVQPTFITDYPVEVSPLTKTSRQREGWTERFELIIGGREIANAYSELNDPQEQRARFQHQLAARAAGDEEAQRMDEDFLTALEHGMPPAGGLGIGIDRLIMLLADVPSIRDVILFPQLKPERND